MFWRWSGAVWRVLLATLSNDDHDGSENDGKKMNLSSFKLNRVYLDPLNKSNAGDFSCRWILTDFIQSQKRWREIRRSMSTSPIKRQIRSFHVVVVQWTSKKCTKKRDARAELLFWSLNLLFFWSRRCGRRSGCLSSLFSTPCTTFTPRNFWFWSICFALLESYQ